MVFIWYDAINKVQAARGADNRKVSATAAVSAVNPSPDPQGSDEQTVPSEVAHRAYQNVQAQLEDRRVFARDIMSSPVETLVPTASIREASEFFKSRRFRHVPVVDRDQGLIGVLSDRQVLRKLAEGRDIAQLENVETLVMRRVLTASPDTELREIARVLFEERIGCMPIVSESGFLEGIITRSDILRAVVTLMPFESWL